MISRRYYLGVANANTVTIKNFLISDFLSLADGPSGWPIHASFPAGAVAATITASGEAKVASPSAVWRSLLLDAGLGQGEDWARLRFSTSAVSHSAAIFDSVSCARSQ